MAYQLPQLPSTGIDPMVYKAYAPAYDTGVKSIQKQGAVASNEMYQQLNKRGVLPSYELPSATIGLNDVIMQNIAALNSQFGTAMAGTQVQLNEAKRQEDITGLWGLLNTALSFISPLAGDVIGDFLKGEKKDEGLNAVLEMLMQNPNDWTLAHNSGFQLSMPDTNALNTSVRGMTPAMARGY